MKQLLIEVQASEFGEYQRSAEKFGKFNNSPHESYAIIKEEQEEAREETDTFEILMNLYWGAVKCNESEAQDSLLKKMREVAEKAAAEWIQVAAMCYKATIPKAQEA